LYAEPGTFSPEPTGSGPSLEIQDQPPSLEIQDQPPSLEIQDYQPPSPEMQDYPQPQYSSSQSSQSTEPEQEVSIWCDEIEIQQQKRHTLNEAIGNLTDGRTSPILSSLNTTWDDVSDTQQNYYSRKAKEAISAMLSVISPGQEDQLWKCVRREDTIPIADDGSSNLKYFDTTTGLVDVLVKAYNQAESWQMKRQILSLFC